MNMISFKFNTYTHFVQRSIEDRKRLEKEYKQTLDVPFLLVYN